jgi:hypothetical protein
LVQNNGEVDETKTLAMESADIIPLGQIPKEEKKPEN